MTATSVSIDTPRGEGDVIAYGVAASTKVLKGTLTQLASGYLTGMTKAASLVFAGVAFEEADNSATATNGYIKGRVYKTGIFEFIMASAAATDVGTEVYALDNQTVTKTSTDATKVGKIVRYENTDKVWIRIGGYC